MHRNRVTGILPVWHCFGVLSEAVLFVFQVSTGDARRVEKEISPINGHKLLTFKIRVSLDFLIPRWKLNNPPPTPNPRCLNQTPRREGGYGLGLLVA